MDLGRRKRELEVERAKMIKKKMKQNMGVKK